MTYNASISSRFTATMINMLTEEKHHHTVGARRIPLKNGLTAIPAILVIVHPVPSTLHVKQPRLQMNIISREYPLTSVLY